MRLLLLLVVIFITFIALGLTNPLLGAAWPAVSDGINVPIHYSMYLFLIMGIGRIYTSITSDKIIKRFGTGIVVLSGVITITAGIFGFSFSASFLSLCFWCILLGFGSALIDVSLNSYVALNYKARHMNWLHCFFGIGASIGPAIISFHLSNNNSWNLGYRAIGLILCFPVVLLFSTLFLWKKKEIPIPNEDKKTDKIPFKEITGIPGIKHILMIIFCHLSLERTIILWGSSFLVMEKNILPEAGALCLSLFFTGMTVGRIISGFLSVKFNYHFIIRLAYCLIICALAALIFSASNMAFMVCFFVLGFGCAPIFPCILYETPKFFGEEKAQAIIGIQMACRTVSSIITVPLFGLMINSIGLNVFPLFLGSLLVITIIMFESFTKKMVKNENYE